MPTPEQTEAERKAAREMLAALESAQVVLGAVGLTGVRDFDEKHLVPRIAKITAAIAAAHAAGIKTGE